MSMESLKSSNQSDFIAMLQSAGYTEQTHAGWIGPRQYALMPNQNLLVHIQGFQCQAAQVTTVRVGCGCGHGGHYVDNHFDADGKLLVHGVWS